MFEKEKDADIDVHKLLRKEKGAYNIRQTKNVYKKEKGADIDVRKLLRTEKGSYNIRQTNFVL